MTADNTVSKLPSLKGAILHVTLVRSRYMKTFMIVLFASIAVIPSSAAFASCSTITGPGMSSGGPCPAPRAIPQYNPPRTTTYSAPSSPSRGIDPGAIGAAAGGIESAGRIITGTVGLVGKIVGGVGSLAVDGVDSIANAQSAAAAQNAEITKETQARMAFDRGQGQLVAGDCAGASASFGQAFDLSNDSTYWRQYSNWRDVARTHCAAKQAVRNNEQQAFNWGVEQLNAGNCTAASDYFNRAIAMATQPDTARMYAQWRDTALAQCAGGSAAPGNVYLSCEEKRRAGYVLDENEIDYCAKQTADDGRRGNRAKNRLRDEISRRLAAGAEEPPHAVRLQCRSGGTLVPNCYYTIVDGQCWQQTLGSAGWNPVEIPIDQCPADVAQSYCEGYSQYDPRTCPSTPIAAVARTAAPQPPPDRFEECTAVDRQGIKTCWSAPRFGYGCTKELRQNGNTMWADNQERCESSDFLLKRNAEFNRYPDPNAAPPERFTMPADETKREIRRVISEYENRNK
jgi:hypothetical protein